VDGIVLFNELTTALGRYLALPEGALEAMALWVCSHTHSMLRKCHLGSPFYRPSQSAAKQRRSWY
jgi:hypothetical protein